MPPNKLTMIHGRLRRRLVAVDAGTLDDYCDFLFKQGGIELEIVHLIDAVTTNKTDFFREPVHFDFIRDKALPELAGAGRRNVKVWSAACSTGAEPYTIAMVLEDFRRDRGGPDYSILATDICTEVLAEALAGRFAGEMMAPVPMEARKRYVLRRRDQTSGEFRIAPNLRSRVAFGRLNLMDEVYPVHTEVDFLFCRNILIYFEKTTQTKVLSRLCRHIRPGGFLILGHSESAAGADLPIIPIANTIFRRR